ncbi:MAG: peptidase M28, partial [Gemmatimonadales bacterium]
MMRPLWLLALVSAIVASGGRTPEPSQAPTAAVADVSTEAMRTHLRVLAADSMSGRAPATAGGRAATRYIAAQLAALGLEPAGRGRSYFQPVQLVGLLPRATLAWGAPGAARALAFGDQFVAWAERPEETVRADADVVFVGYGISAPEWQWDDYKGESLRGKILLMLVNDPGLQDSSVFLGPVLTYYGRWTYKLEEATRRGAAGVLMVHTAESATYPWSVVRSSWTVEQLQLDRRRPESLLVAGWVTEAAARAALAERGLDLDTLTRAAAGRAFRPVATGLHATVAVTSTLRRVTSENVVARLPGRDSVLGREAVLFKALWDHKGIGPASWTVTRSSMV